MVTATHVHELVSGHKEGLSCLQDCMQLYHGMAGNPYGFEALLQQGPSYEDPQFLLLSV